MFDLRGIEVRYGDGTRIAVPDWTSEQGVAWLLCGRSGSGKTTLLHILAGLVRPSSGQWHVAGHNLAKLDQAALDRWRGRNIGLVPQRLHLVDSLTVLQNLLLAQYLAGHRQDRRAALALLEELNIADHAHKLPDQISQGQAQRAAVARAVINRPRLLLADEPTASLDDEHADAAIRLLQHSASAIGATLVVASHDGRVREHLPREYLLQTGELSDEDLEEAEL